MVRDLADYPWSKCLAHGLGRADDLLGAVPGWSRLGRTEDARRAFWRRWVQEPLRERALAAVRQAMTTGRPYGSASWVAATARRLGSDLAARPRGRPQKRAKK
jgi:putative transposase